MGSNHATEGVSYLDGHLAALGREGPATEKLSGVSPLRAGEVFVAPPTNNALYPHKLA